MVERVRYLVALIDLVEIMEVYGRQHSMVVFSSAQSILSASQLNFIVEKPQLDFAILKTTEIQ